MAEPNSMYRALRPKQHHHRPQTNPIAAIFETCRDAFERLCIVARRNSSPAISTSIDGQYGQFLTWGKDSGASTRSLDRALRKTTNLSSIVMEVLRGLYSTLVRGMEKVQETAAVLEEDAEAMMIGSFDASDPGLMLDSQMQENPRISMLIENIEGLLVCLMRVVPNVCDPFPLDEYTVDANPNDAVPDIDIATDMFPAATKVLITRLGCANWRRRKYLKSLQEKRQPGISYSGFNSTSAPRRIKKSQLREVAVDAFNFQKPVLRKDSPPSRPPLRTIPSYLGSSTTTPSVDGESVFSRPGIGHESVTTMSEAEFVVKPMTTMTVPKPPVSWEKGGLFICPYCHDEVEIPNAITTEVDWEGHVFEDLEPYMCTFDKCLRPEKTYGERDEWFRHELESHRILKVWVCQSCNEEFDSACACEFHLQDKHSSICGPEEMAMMVSLFEKYSQKGLKADVCPLCAVKLGAEALKVHVAGHLEQLALTSINSEESSEGDDSDEWGSQKFDDNVSEGRTKLEILNDFVEEQLGYVLPEKKGPADTGVEQTNLDFVGDSDDDSGDESLFGPSNKKGGDEGAVWKVANYLSGHTSKQRREIGNSMRRSGSGKLSGTEPYIQGSSDAPSSTGALLPLRTSARPRDDDFVGRETDLANMYKILSVPGRICTISGTGGIGKTATAGEFTYRYESSYAYVFWTQSETRVGCEDTFSMIALALGLEADDRDQKQLIESSREFLQTCDKRWLLVFDNVDSWEAVEEFIPINMIRTQGSVLVTTRLPDLAPIPIPTNYFHINLKEMTMEESRSLLIQGMQSDLKFERTRFHPEWKVAGEIASLAGLPLAISHIAGYVKASKCSLAEFLELWNEWRRNNFSTRPPEASSNMALETIWNIGLSDLGSDALKLLKIMAFLDSDGIQRELLMNDHTTPALAFLRTNNAFRCRKMVTDLMDRRLIGVKVQDHSQVFSIHRLLQHRLLQDLDDNPQEREMIFNMAFELIRERLPRPSIDSSDSMKWNVFKEYVPHVLTIQKIFDEGLPSIQPFVGLAELFRDGGVHLWQRGLIYDALRLLNSAEAILNRLDCDEDKLRIDIHIATTLLIQYFGISHRMESRDRHSKILEIRQKQLADAIPGTATRDDEVTLCNSQADFGNALLQFNRYEEAEIIYQNCKDKYKEWGSEDELAFEYAKFNHHLAFCRMYCHDFDNAIRLSEKAVELVSRQTGQVQLILRYKFDLASIILQHGDAKKSLEMQEQILQARLSLQGTGKTTYFTLQSYYAVGALYAHLGRLDEAESYMRTALSRAQERADKGFWPDAAVARTDFHLSKILIQNGKDGVEAEALATKARSVLSRLLPFDPLDGVAEEDELALFDHLQPVFGGRFVGTSLLKYLR
ncbi:uncharacterized protein LY89DRAFT_783619 [Mollisia scopiformis]|uniref:C2H2-type domain-containing protein n=1 Tax=Mollisia scopiformis TaxID=149040 RepID=A0A194X5M7_MOLSC|nr:uncharacterized protein LY89DRAFT_783619 [Mollisia scopiformis]KUJ15483.1 hypothetical protein LY89DRAFT_783619 [Mollisia scopiformis]